MKINLLVRLKNKAFWLAIIPALLLVVQTVASLFGYQWDFVVLNQQIAAIINAVFAVLASLGVVVDPTTAGLSDSNRAMGYSVPNKDTEEEVADVELDVEPDVESEAKG